jgi:integrase
VRRAFDEYEDPVEKLLDRSHSPKYLHTIRASLRAWADFTDDTELVADLSKKALRLPPALRQKEKPPLSKQQWLDLREEIEVSSDLHEPVRGELGMLANRGFRCGDVLRLKRKEVHDALTAGVLNYVGKGRKQLTFTVASHWRPYLEIFADYDDWDRVEDLVAPSAHPRTRNDSAGKAIARALKVCGRSIGIEDLNPHLLRHTYATQFFRICRDPEKLRAHMQWASIETAMGYVREDNREELDALAESMFT